MNKRFSLLIVAMIFMGAGCVSTKSVPVIPSQQATQEQTQTPPTSVPEKPTSPIIPTGWATYSTAVQKFAVSYPGTGLTSGGNQIILPPAVGNKERKMSVQIAPVGTKLDSDGCLVDPTQQATKKKMSFNGIPFCISSTSEGAAGSSYVTYDDTAKIGENIVSIQFQIRHLNDVHIVGGCEQEPDQTKQTCKDLAWDEVRDTALFDQIMETFILSK